jgi:hypothetical protein
MQRAVSEQTGIRSWHCFSAGADYDADNLAFGPVIGVDEHLVDPGAGFAEHAHRGVQIITWVLDGQLGHRDDEGAVVLRHGEVLVQLAGAGVRHVEWNASRTDPVRFVQTTLLGADAAPRWFLGAAPVRDTVAAFEVVTSLAWLDGALVHAFVASGSFDVNGQRLSAGDSVRARAESLVIDGAGELLVVRG